MVLLVATQPVRSSAVPVAALLQFVLGGTVVVVVLVLVVDELVVGGTVVVVVAATYPWLCARTRAHLHRQVVTRQNQRPRRWYRCLMTVQTRAQRHPLPGP
ncbi:MAG TPA: hypothetical protein VK425_06640 [Acidimicrobiales bacterium]|nr:hypothetical protein [Acidimicrobiales bacterium]